MSERSSFGNIFDMPDQKPKTLMPFPPMPKFTSAFFISFLLAVTSCQKNDITGMYRFEEPPEFVRTGIFEIDYKLFKEIKHHSSISISNGALNWNSNCNYPSVLYLYSSINSYDDKQLKATLTANGQTLFAYPSNSSSMHLYDTLDAPLNSANKWTEISFSSSTHPAMNFEQPIFIPEKVSVNSLDTIYPESIIKYEKSNHPHTGLIIEVSFTTWDEENEHLKPDTLDIYITNQKILSQETGQFTLEESMFKRIPDGALCRVVLRRKSFYVVESKHVYHILSIDCDLASVFKSYYSGK